MPPDEEGRPSAGHGGTAHNLTPDADQSTGTAQPSNGTGPVDELAAEPDDFFGDLGTILADDLAAFIKVDDRHRSLTVVLEAGEPDREGEIRRFVDRLRADAADVELCAAMRTVLHRYTDGSRDAQRNGSLALGRLDEQGHRGLAAALDELWSVRAKDQRGYLRLVEGARRIVLDKPSPPDDRCRCRPTPDPYDEGFREQLRRSEDEARRRIQARGAPQDRPEATNGNSTSLLRFQQCASRGPDWVALILAPEQDNADGDVLAYANGALYAIPAHRRPRGGARVDKDPPARCELLISVPGAGPPGVPVKWCGLSGRGGPVGPVRGFALAAAVRLQDHR